jgi:hypothetical protein
MTHPLQHAWASAAGEQDYARTITAMIHGGQLEGAAAKLLGDLAAIESPLATLCRSLTPDSLNISGWDDISTAVAHFEGDPVTAVHLVMSNPTDLVFEAKGEAYDPVVEVAFYTDANLPFSTLSPEQLLAESLAPSPDWYGQSEDIEVYAEIIGFADLNTALLRHKTQYFLRSQDDEAEAEDAPLAYVEFTLASLFRAVRFHQAVKRELDAHGLARNVPVIAGMDNMRASIGSVYYPERLQEAAVAEVATLSLAIKPRLDEISLVGEPTGSSLRRRIVFDAPPEEAVVPPEKLGFFKRLFARF